MDDRQHEESGRGDVMDRTDLVLLILLAVGIAFGALFGYVLWPHIHPHHPGYLPLPHP
jgi:hypothetical protein